MHRGGIGESSKAVVGWTSGGVLAFGGGWDEAWEGLQDSCLTRVGATPLPSCGMLVDTCIHKAHRGVLGSGQLVWVMG